MPSTDRELDRLREEFHRELMRKSMRIAELEMLVDRTAEGFHSTLSWRLTRPLRVLSHLRRRLMGSSSRPG